MDLQTIWFILIAVLFIGFFVLEGFDYGVGMLLPFLGKNDDERRVIINTIGPFWDGNEVWMITAGGAMFAAFPHWYATLFSGFYLALFLMLLALISRGVAFEFRSKDERPGWRNMWDWVIFISSAIPALLWGVAFANIIRGVPIDADMNYVGGFFNLLNPYALLGGLAAVSLFVLHGAIFLNLRTAGDIEDRAHRIAQRAWLPAVLFVFLFVIMSYFSTDMFTGHGATPAITALIAGVSLLLTGWLVHNRRLAWAFTSTAVTIAFTTLTLFIGLFPRVMVSSLNSDWDLTIYNASSSHYTLSIMTIAALFFVPIVLIYQYWSYRRFWERLSPASELEY